MSHEYVFQRELTNAEVVATGIVNPPSRLFLMLHNVIDDHPTAGGVYHQRKLLTDTDGVRSASASGWLKNPEAVPPGLLP